MRKHEDVERLWRGTLRCRDCGEVLNIAENVPENKKAQVGMSAPLVAGRCPNGCRSTCSDMNMNTTLAWEPEVTETSREHRE